MEPPGENGFYVDGQSDLHFPPHLLAVFPSLPLRIYHSTWLRCVQPTRSFSHPHPRPSSLSIPLKGFLWSGNTYKYTHKTLRYLFIFCLPVFCHHSGFLPFLIVSFFNSIFCCSPYFFSITVNKKKLCHHPSYFMHPSITVHCVYH